MTENQITDDIENTISNIAALFRENKYLREGNLIGKALYITKAARSDTEECHSIDSLVEAHDDVSEMIENASRFDHVLHEARFDDTHNLVYEDYREAYNALRAYNAETLKMFNNRCVCKRK